jgi:hypothetical protein
MGMPWRRLVHNDHPVAPMECESVGDGLDGGAYRSDGCLHVCRGHVCRGPLRHQRGRCRQDLGWRSSGGFRRRRRGGHGSLGCAGHGCPRCCRPGALLNPLGLNCCWCGGACGLGGLGGDRRCRLRLYGLRLTSGLVLCRRPRLRHGRDLQQRRRFDAIGCCCWLRRLLMHRRRGFLSSSSSNERGP